jgi:hypothetical protein
MTNSNRGIRIMESNNNYIKGSTEFKDEWTCGDYLIFWDVLEFNFKIYKNRSYCKTLNMWWEVIEFLGDK